ncbi:hypothetical protein V9K92_06315 [Phyllobacterium sp. CCNWLW109]|uniref:hypothetical protein n=1 Tax=Phyllobacterium sp. CCNWLW109 TaxID=3127479 RepID=UPI003078395F
MEYTTEAFDRASGDLVTKSIGEWITVTEYGQAKGQGPRKTRAILTEMGLLAPEYFGPSGNVRNRLKLKAVALGLGKRLHPKNGKYPFDVLSPSGQLWADERWTEASRKVAVKSQDNPTKLLAKAKLEEFSKARRSEMTTQMEICWLIDHFLDLSQADVCEILAVPKQTVSRYASLRSASKTKARANRSASLFDVESPLT